MFSLLFYVFLFGLSCIVLATDTSQNTYPGLPQVPEGITVHHVIETWSEAHIRCQNEGAILASPINEKTLNVMKSLMSNNNAMYYIGTKAFHSPGQFISVEGVPVERMNVSLWQPLDPWSGDCLAMTSDRIYVVPCDKRLPYLCYDTHIFNMDKTNCGPGYKFDVPTKSCYKVHTEYLPWLKAQMACVAEGANLAVIDNEIEAESLKNIYKPNSHFWIGLRDYTGKGDWMSVHWQRVEELYNIWANGHKETDFPCGTFHLSSSYINRGNCSFGIDFICEKEPTY